MKFKSVLRAMVFIAVIFALCLVLSLSASAEDADVSRAAAHIAFAVDKCYSEVDLTKYRLSSDELSEAMHEVIYTHPELFYLAESWKYYVDSDKNITRVVLEYRCDVSEIPAKRTEYIELLSEFVAKCGIDDSLSDFERVLAVHDTMITLYTYDSEYNIDTSYGMLKSGKGVCEAYSLLFLEVMRYCDIESFIALNIPEKHCWNMVKLGGQWYHLDLTWDDPVTAARGTVNHNYFLVNDSELAILNLEGGGHASWTPRVSATGNAYDFEALRSQKYPFCLVDGKWYSIDRDRAAICRYDISDFSSTAIYNIKDKWYVLGKQGNYWQGCFSGFGAYNGRLYFNTPTKLASIDTAGKNRKTFTPNLSDENIYDMEIVGDVIIYYVAASPNDEKRAVRVRISDDSEETTLPTITIPEITLPEDTDSGWDPIETTGPEATSLETSENSAETDTEKTDGYAKRKSIEMFGCKISVCVTFIPALVVAAVCFVRKKD